jgi:zinc D-Ala-D-Ala carboxypeptidase
MTRGSTIGSQLFSGGNPAYNPRLGMTPSGEFPGSPLTSRKMKTMQLQDYRLKVQAVLDALAIPNDIIARKRLPIYLEATELEVVETDPAGRDYLLIPAAAQAWRELRLAARKDQVVLEIVSAFRSIERQIEIIRAKQARGMPVEQILTLSAPPGYSEHHTGRAVDINTPGCEPTEEPFENTDAFEWLSRHAGQFGYSLSYPRGNALGFVYEPWHWCYQVHHTGPTA